MSPVSGNGAPHEPHLGCQRPTSAPRRVSDPTSAPRRVSGPPASAPLWVSEPHLGYHSPTSSIRAQRWVPEPHINPILGIRVGGGGYFGHRTPCWGSQTHIIPTSITRYQSPMSGIATPYQPCSHHQAPEPHIGYQSPISAPYLSPGIRAPYHPCICHWVSEPHVGYRSPMLGTKAPYQPPRIHHRVSEPRISPVSVTGYQSPTSGTTDWASLPHIGYRWPLIGHRWPFGASRCPRPATLRFPAGISAGPAWVCTKWNKKVPPRLLHPICQPGEGTSPPPSLEAGWGRG